MEETKIKFSMMAVGGVLTFILAGFYIKTHTLYTPLAKSESVPPVKIHECRNLNTSVWFNASSVHVFQGGDVQHLQKMHQYTSNIKKWAENAAYKYTLVEWNKQTPLNDICAHTHKVVEMYNYISTEMKDNELFLFLDTDVLYVHDQDCHAWQTILPVQSTDNQSCDMFGLSTAHSINTGVFIIRKTNFSVDFMLRWKNEQQLKGYCVGPGDQIAFSHILLQIVNKSYDGECAALLNPSLPIADYEWSLPGKCFAKRMNQLGYIGTDTIARQFNHFCGLSCNDKLQLHDCDSAITWKPTVFYHLKQRVRYKGQLF